MITCPYCEAEVSETAQKCRSCGEWVKKPPAPTLTFGCPSCHVEVRNPKQRPDGRFECPWCGKAFTREAGMATKVDRRLSPETQRPTESSSRSAGLPAGLIALVLVVVVFVALRLQGNDNEPAGPSPRVVSVATAALSVTIPGLTAADITGNLERRGLECTGPEGTAGDTYWWNCSNSDLYVSVSGSPTRIAAVSATAIGLADDEAARVLGFLATLPYDGGNPTSARAWVEGNLSAGGTTVFGKARFTLTGPEFARSLDVTALDR